MRNWRWQRWTGSVALLMACGAPVGAHPLGNLGISHHSALRVGTERIDITYTLDFAEIPTFQESYKHALVNQPGHASLKTYLNRLAEQLRAGLKLVLNNQSVALQSTQPCTAQFSDGAAGMATMRVSCDFAGALPSKTSQFSLHYSDRNYAQRSGWKEIVLSAQPSIVVSTQSVPREDRSRALSRYPSDALAAPPQVLEARAVFQITAQK